MAVKPRGVKEASRRGTLKWTPDLVTTFDFRKLEEPLLKECFERAEALRKDIQAYARENAPWGHNRPDGLGKETPRARPGLFAFKERQKSGIVIGLSHGPRTVNRGFQYGIALETFKYERITHTKDGSEITNAGGGKGALIIHQTDGEGTYAIINPTLQKFAPQMNRLLSGALNTAAKKAGFGSTKKGGSVTVRRQ